jgi:type II secretory ATPase GspE/PulE/Tfp pilus assembly ATPase PilB-like protein
VTLTVEGHAVDIRIVTVPAVHGEGIVLRLLDKQQALIGLDSLGTSSRGSTRSR